MNKVSLFVLSTLSVSSCLLTSQASVRSQEEPFCFAVFSSQQQTVDLTHMCIEDEPLPQDVYEQGYPLSEDLVERGRNLALNQQYEEAIIEFTREIEVNADNAQAYEARGHSYVLIGNRDAARRDFERAAQIRTRQGNTRYAEWLRQFSTQLAEETASSS